MQIYLLVLLENLIASLFQAYTSICDLLIIFSPQLNKIQNPYVQALEYKPTEHQIVLLNEFVKIYVFTSKHEGKKTFCQNFNLILIFPFFTEALDETKIEELHKKRNFLAAFSKLIVYNIVPIQAASDIFKYYIKVSEFLAKNSIKD